MNKSKQIKKLLAIKKPSDIKSFKILNMYEDDHLDCAECKINNVRIDFMWRDSVGFVEYWDESKKAFSDLKSAIKDEYDMAVDYEEQYGDED